ncbi:MAG: hypothetical protein AAF399_17405 [Bacteroidota bacterium]
MSSHYDLSDQAYAEKFAQGRFPARLFSHEAHLRLAWIHLRQHGLEMAIANMREQIPALAVRCKVPEKYNDTVTVAAVYAIHRVDQHSSAADFPAFLAEHPELHTQFRELLSRHYSIDIFRSPEAKARYLEPDLLPF